MEAAMHPKSFCAAHGFTLLALALQLLALPASARHQVERHQVERHQVERHQVERRQVERRQVERRQVEQAVVCTSPGTLRISTGDAAPAHEESWQTTGSTCSACSTCALCSLSLHTPCLPGRAAPFPAPDRLAQGKLPTTLLPPAAKRPSHSRAQPRAPPL